MKEEIRVQLLSNTNEENVSNEKLHKFTGDSAIHHTTSSITPMLLFSAFIAFLGSFSLGYIVAYTSPVQAEVMKELNLSTAEYSLFGSMSSIGGAIGAIVCGKLADYLGRRSALKLCDLFYIFGWFVISVAQDAWLLDLGRCMLGYSMAISAYVAPIYVAEFTPKDLRGRFVYTHVFMLATGSSAAFLIGLVITWRTLALIGIIPSLLQIIGLFFIPESPRWLMMKSKNKEFEAALQCLRGDSINISQEATDIKEHAEALHQLEKVGIVQLFQKKYAYVLTVGIGLAALVNLVGLPGVMSYASSIFESAGFSVTVGTIALAFLQLPSVGLGIFLMDKCGRRPLLMERRLLGGFSPYLALIGILIFVASYPVGIGGVSAVITSEIYPLNIKGLAGSVAALVSWLSAWTVSYAFNFSMEWSSSGTFFVLAGVSAFALIFVAKLVPETKGKTLEEVHMSISNVWQ
ncbi:sugar transporter ERD6-like 5 isoform X2 [Beta vulgaris subsp. vulgaris]|uniref:sugar transporter ERD6-like 5 isoform X2 n=1 Tax=Beta vulgaris subsp. vulgaris TaxID=3555 RepID=UPI0020374381|nr:sugar transporter ERD6-like 5 isoform X2 [Beta vulgaris subsp. vulgaris]